MKPLIKSISAITLSFLLIVFSCKKKKDPGPQDKSVSKEIQSFSFSGLNPAVTAVIDLASKMVKAEVPPGTDLTKLVPTISLSAAAKVTPASGAAQDFSKPVTYTVTAENGSTQAYTATVTIQNNGTVYVGNLDGDFYALDALTGTKKWSFKAGGSINGTPTVGSGVVYFASWDKKLYALDAETGAKKWESNTATIKLLQPFAAPMVVNGMLYYGGEHHLYGMDAQTGAKKWEYQHDEVYGWSASPTVVDGVVYASIRGSSGGKSGLHALNATTGTLKWHQPAIGISESSPAIANGLLFAGSEYSGFMAFDAQTGAVKWKFDSGLIVNSSPTVANGVVYVGASAFGANKDNDKLYALDAVTGIKKWEFKTLDGGPDYSSPVVANGIVYIGAGPTLYAVDAGTGAKKWEARTEAGNLIFSGAVVSSGLVYIGIGRKMYAFDAATGSKKWEYETSRGIDQSSPCVLDKNGTAWHAGISGMVQ